MREIRFRAWDSVRKRMVYEGNVNFNGWVWDFKGEDCPLDTDVLMQYTGLKDKNRKEIYEGDVIVSHANGTYQGEVRYSAPNWLVVWGKDGLSDAILLDSLTWYGMEIIGNIYENPELLDDQA